VRVIVNGESRELDTGCSVAQLLAQLRLTAGRVAVEINEEVVPRDSYPARHLTHDDHVEIVHFVGGG